MWEYFKFLVSLIKNSGRFTREIKFRIAMASVAFAKKKTLLFHHQNGIQFKKGLMKYYILVIPCYGEESWTLQKVDQKCLESFEMLCWRGMENTIWIYRVNNEVLRIFEEEKNILCRIKRQRVKLIGRMLRMNSLLEHFIDGKIEGTGRRRRRIRRKRSRRRKGEEKKA
jgi:hypothetical protein